jgi:Protein of unknown function (DUF642)/PEP-CTERM motif
MFRKTACAAALAVAASTGSATAASILANGGFEGCSSGNTILGGGSSAIAGWQTVNEGVEWFTPPLYGGTALEGNCIVDLAWFVSSGAPGGGIEQTVSTVAGSRYVVNFSGTTASSFGRDGTGIIDLLIDGSAAASFTVVNFSSTFPATSYQSFSHSFVASGAATTIRFANAQNAFQHFAFIDGASLELMPMLNGVPEPASWALLLAGFGLVGAATRRRGHVPVVTA